MQEWIHPPPLPSEDKYGDHNLTPDDLRDHPFMGRIVRVKGTSSPDFIWLCRRMRWSKTAPRVAEVQYPTRQCPRQWWDEPTLEVYTGEC